MRVIQCPNVIKPKVEARETRRFGLPVLGTAGQNTNIVSILIHCVPEIPPIPCGDKPALHRAAIDWRTSYHYLIPKEGRTIYQDVQDRDTAWGLSPKVTLGSSTVDYDCGLFPTFTAIPGQPLDRGVIHIALERVKSRATLIDKFIPKGGCGCESTQLIEQFNRDQVQSLVKLIAWLSNEYGISLDVSHINFRHNIDMCEKEECGCDICMDELYCRVDSYCASIALPSNPNIKDGELVYVYGEDKYGEQKRETVASLLTRYGVTFTAPPL
jgi:hypothetical protein